MDYSRHYRRWHDDSDDHFVKEGDAAFMQLKAFLPEKSAKIFEFGCGMGFALGALIRHGYRYVDGIDTSAHQISAANKRGLPAKLVDATSTERLFLDRKASYDFIYSFDVLEHLPPADTIEIVSGLVKLLKPGGTFFCRVPNSNSPISCRQRYNDWTHYTLFSDPSLDFVLFNSGLTEITTMPTPDVFPGLKGGLSWALRRVVRGGYFLQLAAETNLNEARRTSLSPNLIAIGHRPKDQY